MNYLQNLQHPLYVPLYWIPLRISHFYLISFRNIILPTCKSLIIYDFLQKSFLAVEALEHCRSLKVTFKLACSVTPSVLAALHYNIMRTSVIPDRLIMLWKTGMVVNFMDQEMIYQVNLNGKSACFS